MDIHGSTPSGRTGNSGEGFFKLLVEEPTITSAIEKTSSISVITDINEKVPYTITYTATITKYAGDAKVTIVDKLPYEIDERSSTIPSGYTYNATERTLTWTETITDISTYLNGDKEITINKYLELVFINIDTTKTKITNEVEGIIELYTPEKTDETDNKIDLSMDFNIDILVEKIWDDNEDEKGHRPEKVTLWLTGNGKMIEEYDEELEEGKWSVVFENMPKYTYEGVVIDYGIVEKEIGEDDLEYYETAEVKISKVENYEKVEGSTITEETIEGMEYDDIIAIVVNSLKELESNIEEEELEKTGEELVTTSSQEVNYTIRYEATIDSYIGGITVTIVDTLPYELATDEKGELVEGIELAGGEYKEEDGIATITWTEEIKHINTFKDNEGKTEEIGYYTEEGKYKIEIEKEITLIYGNLDATKREMTNKVTSQIYLEETEVEKNNEDDHITKIEIPGRVIIEYIDIDTGEEIIEGYEIDKLVGEEYSTEPEEIYGYTLVEIEGEPEGEIPEGESYVRFYYKKKPFNLAIDKTISKIELNGEEQSISDGKLTKQEIAMSDIETADLKITYTIVVSNTGELEGTAEVIETIPDYFKVVVSGTSSEWNNAEDGTLRATVNLAEGETKELTVVLKWENGNSNFGTIENIATLANVDNILGFEEESTEDNISTAELILSIKTGLDESIDIIRFSLGILLIVCGIMVYIRKEI